MHLVTHRPTPSVQALDDDRVTEWILREQRPGTDTRPWVLSNMVSSVDGAATVNGLSGELGGPGDLVVFGALRAVADVIVAGAETVRAERYRLPRAPSDQRGTWRTETGRPERPRLCIVTRNPRLDGLERLLDDLPAPPTDDPELRPIFATSDVAADIADERFDVVRCGATSVSPDLLLTELGKLGARTVLCEGGPNLLGQFAEADLVDEWNFTIAAAVTGGPSTRPVVTTDQLLVGLELDRTFIHDDGTFLVRYLRADQPGPTD